MNLISASKKYKRKLNYFINKHNKSMQHKLGKMKNKNPKEYWKIINNIDSKNTDSSIKTDALYTFFKDLNKELNSNDDSCDPNIDISINDDDEILNSRIIDSEIMNCIKLLKILKHVQMTR